MDYRTALCVAQGTSETEECVVHVNKRTEGQYVVSDWYDSETTKASYENGKLKS